MPKIKQSVETSVLDEHGNMVDKRANRTLSWGTEPPFIKLYLQDILYLSDMPKSHESILFELLKRSTYAGDEYGMTVTLSSGMKQIIANTLKIKNVRSINNALSELVKGNVLFRIATGVYQFNPYFFGKGEWQDIDRLRLEINYDAIKGKTFRAVCEYADQQKEETATREQIAREKEHAAKAAKQKIDLMEGQTSLLPTGTDN